MDLENQLLIRILLGLENSQMGMALIDGKKYSQLGDNPFVLLDRSLTVANLTQPEQDFSIFGGLAACGVDRNRCKEMFRVGGVK